MRIFLDLSDVPSWPTELRELLEEHDTFLRAWETEPPPGSHRQFDEIIIALHSILRNYWLVGWHCTRLTDSEIEGIRDKGMQPPNADILRQRIDDLERTGTVGHGVAERLRQENQAHEDNRAGKIWFCFFPPHRAGESGIERLFRRWGGEALYNSHESDPETGTALTQIGRPCLIEAEVQIECMSENKLAFIVYKSFLAHNGFEVECDLDYEDYSNWAISADRICRIIMYPETDFLMQTGCESWRNPLD